MAKRFYTIGAIVAVGGILGIALAVRVAFAGHLGLPPCVGGYCISASGSFRAVGASYTGTLTVTQQMPPRSDGLYCVSLGFGWWSASTGPLYGVYPSDPSTCNDVTSSVSKTRSFDGVDGGRNLYEGAAQFFWWDGSGFRDLGVVTNSPTSELSLPAPSVTLTASPNPITAGQNTTFTIAVSGTALSCTARADPAEAGGYYRGALSLPPSGSGPLAPTSPSATGTQYLDCTNSGGTGTGSVAMTVLPALPPPPLNVAVAPNPARHGDSGAVTWSPVGGATSYVVCSDAGAGAVVVCAPVPTTVCAGATCTVPVTFGTSATDTVVVPGAHRVAVGACNAAGCTDPASVTPVSFTVQSNNAAFVSQDIPNTARPGETFTARVTFRNTGESTWDTPGQYVLRSEVGSFEVALPAVVLPSQTVTFSGPLRIDASGIYPYRWRMYRRENNFGFFGQSGPDSTIRVTGPVSAEPIRVQLQIRAKQHLPIQ